MNSDSVSTLAAASSTEEALVVASIAEQTYQFIHSQNDWPYKKKLTTLEGLSDSTKPNYLKIPDGINEVEWFKYNNKSYTYISQSQFLDDSEQRQKRFDNGDVTITKVTDFGGVDIYIRNDIDAVFYTSFDDNYLVFDGYDKAIQTTMHSALSKAYVVEGVTFTIDDNFIPFLPEGMESYFQAEINSAAHKYLRQTQSLVDEKRSLQGRSKLKTKIKKLNVIRRNGFGRK